ncbi:alpha subunit of prefoldin [Chloropicon roscoffensis]|uniref:Alpha subunit of prefoldin n=1 Tax=Chloropicon roscoffensis TaxID=1461544 RepID=A0AAX4PKD7_9CHLO
MASQEGNRIDLMTLPPQQLAQLKEQLEQQIEQFSMNFQDLQNAISGFHSSGLAIEDLSRQKEGKDVLIPLTSSLYVGGTLGNPDNVMVDIGTGYYVEKTAEGGRDYCKRKVMILTKALEDLAEIIKAKRQQVQQCQRVLQMKMQQFQQQEQQGASV